MNKEWNETILKLLEMAETLYKIDGESVLHDLSSDGMKILGDDFDITEIADKLELLAKVMFCDYYDRKELKRFLEGRK